MTFKIVNNPIDDTEMELFEGYIDFLSIKEKKSPDQFGNTHTVSVCVDSVDGKNGVWMFLPPVKEGRVRQEGRAISVKNGNEWVELCKGCKIKTSVKRNGDYINAKILKVLEVVDAPTPVDVKEPSKPTKSTYSKPYPIGAQVCHSRTAAADLCSNIKGLEFSDAMKAAHEATAFMKVYVATNNKDWSESEIGNEAGNCVNASCKMVYTVEDLPKYCINHHKQKKKWEEVVKSVNENLSTASTFSYKDFGLEPPVKEEPELSEEDKKEESNDDLLF